VCGVANIHMVEICCIGSRGTAGELVSVSQVIFMPIVVFIEKIGPHPTSPYKDGAYMLDLYKNSTYSMVNEFHLLI
jgi:hypothetical protein